MSPDEIDALPWRQLGDNPGVTYRVLWRSGDVFLGTLHLEPGAVEPERVHLAAHIHFLVTQGSARIVDRMLEAGSYAYIPPGVPHEVAASDEGCTLFYTYRPFEIPTGQSGSPLDEDWGVPG